jgi:hypothetical protein
MGILYGYANPISWGNSVDLWYFSENSKKRDPGPSRITPYKGQKRPIFCRKYSTLGGNLVQKRGLLRQFEQERA